MYIYGYFSGNVRFETQKDANFFFYKFTMKLYFLDENIYEQYFSEVSPLGTPVKNFVNGNPCKNMHVNVAGSHYCHTYLIAVARISLHTQK